MPMQPKPKAETTRPWVPRFRCCTLASVSEPGTARAGARAVKSETPRQGTKVPGRGPYRLERHRRRHRVLVLAAVNDHSLAHDAPRVGPDRVHRVGGRRHAVVVADERPREADVRIGGTRAHEQLLAEADPAA